MENFLDFKKVYFIGIGGIGMSALARFLKNNNIQVVGSDPGTNEIVEGLKKEDIKIFSTQEAGNVDSDVDAVVYTLAIKEDNPELLEAKRRQLPVFTYAQALGKVTEKYYTIAVSGTHGKTTTTAMVTKIFQDLDLKPTAIVGSLLSESNSNFVSGSSKYFIVEACEYGRSFHELSPDILIITNIEEDHLDYYKDFDEIKESFKNIVSKIPDSGFVVCNLDDEDVREVVKASKAKIINYKDFLGEVPELFVPGKHNIENAAAALSVVKALNFENQQKAIDSLKNFKGTKRRLELKGETLNGALVYDDYAHHPNEIKASLSALKEKYKDKKILVIFQPHLYSRTKVFLSGFAEVLGRFSDRVIVLPIYAAREKEDKEIDSLMIVEEIDNDKSEHVHNFFEATKISLDKSVDQDWIIVTVGAGDVNRISNMLALELAD